MLPSRRQPARPPGRLRIGPYAVSTGELAITISVIVHLLIGAAMWYSYFRPAVRAEPQFARGEQTVTVTRVRFITQQELDRMLHPQRLKSAAALPTPQPPAPPKLTIQDRPAAPAVQPPTPESADVTPPLPTGSRPAPATSHPPQAPPQIHHPSPPPAPATARSAPQPPAPPVVQLASNTIAPAGITRGVEIENLTMPKYPLESRRLGEEGRVILLVSIDALGRVTDVQVLTDPGYPRLVEAAVHAVRHARFQPALENGRPVADTIRIPFRFQLKSR